MKQHPLFLAGPAWRACDVYNRRQFCIRAGDGIQSRELSYSKGSTYRSGCHDKQDQIQNPDACFADIGYLPDAIDASVCVSCIA